jgi:archaellum component FlaC
MRGKLFFIFFFANIGLYAQIVNEIEPNNTFSTANSFIQGTTMTGNVGGAGDANDYFIGFPIVGGTLKIYLEYTNSAPANHPGIFLYAYRNSQASIGTRFIYSIPTGTHSDSLIIHCRNDDTVFFRLSASQAIDYQIQYSVQSHGTNDVEPNNTFSQAQYYAPNDTLNGWIGQSGAFTDNDDYFQTHVLDGGTFNLYFDYFNTSGSGSNSFLVYVYNKNQASIGNKFMYSVPRGIPQSDTLTIHCRDADTIYIRISSSGCFSYSVHHEVVPSGINDIEPNNTFSEALFFAPTDTIHGRIGLVTTTTDNNDYFKTYVPDGGTFNLYFDYFNTSGSGSNSFLVYVYNKNQASIGNKFMYSVPRGIPQSDTLTIHCRDADTIYIRISSSGCFSYSVHHEVVPSGINDIEPNNTFSEALFFAPTDTIHGRIGLVTTTTDNNDYFKTYVPDGGTFNLYFDYFNTSSSGSNSFLVYVYNKNQASIGNKFMYSVPRGTPQTDTLTIHCRDADTIYIRISSNGCFSYFIHHEVVSPEISDPEPNNSFTDAVFFPSTDSINGRIGFITTTTDNNDYFKTYMPDGGTFNLYFDYINTSGSGSNSFLVYVYNKNQATIGNKFLYSVPRDMLQSDTLTIHCREADTIFIRISSNGCFGYTFYYDVENFGPNDTEPNNTRQTAQPISIENKLNGRIGYISTSVDNNDYFKFYNPTNSQLKVFLEAINTSGQSNRTFNFYAYRGSGAQILYLPFTGLGPGSFSDTITLNCLQEDTIFLRVTSNACFSYSMEFDLKDISPKAQIIAVRTGNEVAFMAELANTNSFQWNFDDGTTSTLTYPKKEFGIGTYYVTLTAQNTTCNLTDIDTFFVEVKGIEYFTPNFAGAGGDAMMQIFGGGLDTNTTVSLKMSGIEIIPNQKYGNSARNELQILFDLHFADPGLYDVEIQIPGEPLVVFPNGFEIRDFEYPFTYSEIIGPDLWRPNRNTRYVLSVGNRGNVKANGVLAFLIWPKSVRVEFLTEWFRPPDSGAYTIELNPEVLNLNYKDIQVFYDSAFAVPFPIDSFAGQPYDGFMKIVQISAIAPGGTYEIPFLANASSTGNLQFVTYTSKPNLFGSCGNGSWGDMSENLAIEALDAIDMGLGYAKMDKTPVGWLAKAAKATTKHMANLGQAMGATYNYLDGTTNSIYESLPADYMANVEAGNMQVASAVLEVGADALVARGAQNFGKKTTQDLNKWMANNPNASLRSFELALDNLNDINDIRNFIEDAYKTGKDLKTLGDKLSRLQELTEDCPELQKQVEDLQKELDKEMKQREKKEKDTRVINSFDPNAIYGPTGVLEQRFVNHIDKHSFLVTFENVDTASASAQIVRIQVPVDTNAFDMRSFNFGDFSIGTKTYRVPKNRKEFTIDVDFDKKENYFVRVMAYLDTVQGVIHCQFVTLDTLTSDLPIVEGFLPPNANAPDGEGSISYTLKLKSDIPDGYNTVSIADIVFDQNTPIITDPWSNVIDRIPSSSFAGSSLENDSIIVEFNGSDATSGVDFYYLYVSVDGTEWVSLTGTSMNEIKLFGEEGKTYDFFALSVDRVGNEEIKTPVTESSVVVPRRTSSDKKPVFQIVPNPNTGNFALISSLTLENAEVLVTNSHGQLMDQFTMSFVKGQRTEVDMSYLSAGVYNLRILTKDGHEGLARMVIAKH